MYSQKKETKYMKKEGRSKLICRKELSNGQIDMFEVVVLTSSKNEEKKYYESMGYKVTSR